MGHDEPLSDVVAVDAGRQLDHIRALHDRALGGVPFVVDSAGGVKEDDLVFGIEGAHGRLAGYVYASVRPPERIHIWEVAIDPTVQRRGLGRALLRRLAEFCDAGGFELITVTPFATPAQVASAFFSACGFHEADPRFVRPHNASSALPGGRALPRDTRSGRSHGASRHCRAHTQVLAVSRSLRRFGPRARRSPRRAG